MSLFRMLPGNYCIRCSYKHLLLYLFGFYFVLILIWMIITLYVDIVPSTKPETHYLSSKISKIPKINKKRNKNEHENATENENITENENLIIIHTMYSVGCDDMVMWQLQQSIVLDYSWYNVNQPGHLTRIVSGCNYAANNILTMSKTSIPIKPDIHVLNDAHLINKCLLNYNNLTNNNNNTRIFSLDWNWNQRFHIIFVPSFDDIKKEYPHIFGANIDRYPQLNRILALYILYHCTNFKNINYIKQDYMMMIDPDFVFLKPINNMDLNKYGLALNHPIAARYGLGNKWVRWLKLSDIHPSTTHNSEAGVPYILHNIDWYNLIPQWMSWISFAYSKYDGIESDMYAYIIAAYKLGLKHTLIEEFMSTCMKSMDQRIHPLDDNTVFIHYCSSYKVDISQFKDMVQKIGDPIYTFNKHWTKARRNRKTKEQQLWMIECESPLLIEIPKIDSFEKYDGNGNGKYRKEYKQYQVIRTIVPMFNNALIAFKEKHCENKTIINRDKKIITHEAVLENGDILYHIVDDI